MMQMNISRLIAGRESRDSKLTQFGNDFSMMNTGSGPQAQSFTFQSSTVTYGGSNGAYYTSSTTKRTGSDGVSNVKMFSENFLIYTH